MMICFREFDAEEFMYVEKSERHFGGLKKQRDTKHLKNVKKSQSTVEIKNSSLTIAEPKSSVENTKKNLFFYRFEAVSAE